MSLESGQYCIYTAAGDFPIGRRPWEDKSFNPKGIYKLSEGTGSMWEVEKLDNGNYKLKNRGAIVGGIAGGHLLAYLIPAEALTVTTEWVFERDVQNADSNAYAITMANGDDGWLVPEQEQEGFPHILLRPLIVGMSNPPTYPPNEVFIFKKVDA